MSGYEEPPAMRWRSLQSAGGQHSGSPLATVFAEWDSRLFYLAIPAS